MASAPTETSQPATVGTSPRAAHQKSPADLVRRAVGRSRIVSTSTFSAMTIVAFQPLRGVFTNDADRAELLRSLVTVVIGLAATGLVLRVLKLPWWLGPPVGVALTVTQVFAQVRTYRELDPGWTVTPEGLVRRPSWYRFAAEAARTSVAEVDRLKTPTPAILGFAVVTILLIGLLVVVTHILVFEVEGIFESLAPPAAILVVSSALAPGQGSNSAERTWALLFVALAGAHVVVESQRLRRTRTRWMANRPPGWARTSIVLVALATGLFFAGSAVSQKLGDGSLDRSIDWRTGLPKVRRLESPTVSLRRRLVDLADTPFFTVDVATSEATPLTSYWRQAALDRFDGQAWSQSPRRYRNIRSGDRLETQNRGGAGRVVRQKITITGLVDSWLPMAYAPTKIVKSPRTYKLSFDPATASVIADRDSSKGITYEIESELPGRGQSLDEVLDTATVQASTVLPESFPERARVLAEELTADAEGDPAEAGALLQQFFQSKFQYDTTVTWNGRSPLETFLFDDRVGYCEQFSSAFAAMARSIGIPARVAIGFTTGTRDGTSYTITGKNAHAWPELLIAGRGWVPFEPTPGRGPGVSTPTSTVTPTTAAPVPTTAPAAASTIAAETPESDSDRGKLVVLLAGVLTALGLAGFVVRRRRPLHQRARSRAIVTEGISSEMVELEWAWYEVATLVNRRLQIRSGPEVQSALVQRPVGSPKLRLARRELRPSASFGAGSTPNELAALARAVLNTEDQASFADLAAIVTTARFARPGTLTVQERSNAQEASNSLRDRLVAEDRAATAATASRS